MREACFVRKRPVVRKDLLQMFKKLSAPLSLLSKLNNMAKLVAENGLGLIRADKSIDRDRKYSWFGSNACVGIDFLLLNVM